MNTKKKARSRAARAGARKTNFNPARAVKLYKANSSVADIAVAMGYPRGHGQNRVRAALMSAGVYNKAVRAATHPAPAASEDKGKDKVLAMPVPTGPDMALQECYRVVESRYRKLVGRQRTGFVEKLTGMLLTGMGETKSTKVSPVALPEGLHALRGTVAAA